MSVLRLLSLLSLLVLGSAAVPPPEPARIYVMRHLEKGVGDDPPLSAKGAADARRLVTWFARDRPSAIYVSTARRARETAAPLALALRLTAKPYDPRNTPALIEQVRSETGAVLIVGHSNTVPEIVTALGGTRPDAIAEDRYGDIFQISGPSRSVEKLHLDSRKPAAAKKR